MSDQRVPIPGSEISPREGERWSPRTASDQPLTVTLLLRRHSGAPSAQELMSGHYQAPPREQAAAALAADPSDMQAVRAFADEYGLSIESEDSAARSIKLQGSASQMDRAFGVQLQTAEASDGRQYLTYSGSISVPSALDGIVTAVLGLDQRPIARHHLQ